MPIYSCQEIHLSIHLSAPKAYSTPWLCPSYQKLNKKNSRVLDSARRVQLFAYSFALHCSLFFRVGNCGHLLELYVSNNSYKKKTRGQPSWESLRQAAKRLKTWEKLEKLGQTQKNLGKTKKTWRKLGKLVEALESNWV